MKVLILIISEGPFEGLQDGQPGAAPGGSPVPLGKHQEQRRDPEAREPLPDALSVDEALTQGGQQETGGGNSPGYEYCAG